MEIAHRSGFEINNLSDEVNFFRKRWRGVADHVFWQSGQLLDGDVTVPSLTSKDPALPLALTFDQLNGPPAIIKAGVTDELTLLIVLAGNCVVQIGTENALVGADEVFALSPYEKSTVTLRPECTSALTLRLQFHPDLVYRPGHKKLEFEYLRPFYESALITLRHVPQSAPESEEIICQVRGIYDELKSNDEGYRLRIHARLLCALLPLAEYQRERNNQQTNLHRENFVRFRPLIQYLGENYQRKIGLQTAARVAIMSPNYLCKRFKAATGFSFVRYLARLRIDKAIDLLVHTSIGIGEISFRVGFANYAYFNRIFRRETNLSPQRYRNQHMKHSLHSAADQKPILAVSMSSLDNIGWAAIYMGMISACSGQKNELVALSAENSLDEQLEQVEGFIKESAKVIIINPVNSFKTASGVTAANRAGIPVVCVDRSTVSGNVAMLVESDNVACGRLAASLMSSAAARRQLSVLVLQGDLFTSAGLERNKGFSNAVRELNGISISTTLPCYWHARSAQEAVLQTLVRHPEINSIFLPSDNAYIRSGRRVT